MGLPGRGSQVERAGNAHCSALSSSLRPTLRTAIDSSAVTNSSYSYTILPNDIILVWGNGFSKTGGNTLQFVRPGYADVLDATRMSIGSLQQLQRMLEQLREGDVVVTWKLDRLARSTRDLLETMETIRDAGARFQSLSEPWADTTTHAGKMIMTVFAGIAEFERDWYGSGRKLGAMQREREASVSDVHKS